MRSLLDYFLIWGIPLFVLFAFRNMYLNEKRKAKTLLPAQPFGYMTEQEKEHYSPMQLAVYEKQIRQFEKLVREQINYSKLISVSDDERIYSEENYMFYYSQREPSLLVFLDNNNALKECGYRITIKDGDIESVTCSAVRDADLR